MSIFEQASRACLRFDTAKGQVSVEDLWELPLTSGTGKPNLDDIAKGLHRELKNTTDTVSFVTPAASSNGELQLKFDVVKHIIDVRVSERDKAADAAKRRETKQRILEIIATKQDEDLRGKSVEELTTLANSL